MDNNDGDLFSILHSCKSNAYTSPITIFETFPPPQTLTTTSTTTNSIISSQNTTPFYFDDFSLIQENRSSSFSPLKPTDFIELDKLKINFNPTTVIPIHTTTIPITITPATTILATPTTITSATFTNPSLPSNIFTPIDTTTTPSITTMINTNTSCHGTNNYHMIYNFPKPFEQEQIQQNQNNLPSSLKPAACIEITTAHFIFAYNHPSISKQCTRVGNQLPNLQPPTSYKVLQNTDPQGELCKNKKRKFDNQKIVEWHISVEKLAEDPWEWRKYGQKPIKGSRYLRDYYKCNTFKDCLAKKQVEKKPNKENIYIVTYIGEHNHPKPIMDWSSHNKSSKKRLSGVKKYGYLPNIRNSSSPSTVMSQFDQAECSNAQVYQHQSKANYQETGL